jgi:hypothetical protein
MFHFSYLLSRFSLSISRYAPAFEAPQWALTAGAGSTVRRRQLCSWMLLEDTSAAAAAAPPSDSAAATAEAPQQQQQQTEAESKKTPKQTKIKSLRKVFKKTGNLKAWQERKEELGDKI